jgi:hypothetical protein
MQTPAGGTAEYTGGTVGCNEPIHAGLPLRGSQVRSGLERRLKSNHFSARYVAQALTVY